MMIGPEGEITAGRGGMRTSRAEREHAVEVLKVAFVQGRLTKDELDVRAGQALTARTCAELAALTADIPAGPPEAQPLRKPARTTAGPPMNRRVLAPAGMIPIAATVLGALLLAQPDNIAAFAAGLLAAATVVVASIVTLVLMLKSRHQRHSGRRRTAEAIRDDLDGPHLVLLVLTFAVLFATVVTAMK
jgi:hypothetical protein